MKGIYCDHGDCDYHDPEVPEEDYWKFIDAPCPKCGQSLITQADYQVYRDIKEYERHVDAYIDKHPILAKFLIEEVEIRTTGQGLKGISVMKKRQVSKEDRRLLR